MSKDTLTRKRAEAEVARLRALPVTDPWADFEEEEE